MEQKLIIGVSKLAPNYESWLKRLSDRLEIIDLYSMDSEEAVVVAKSAHGLLLTGGCDVNPALYDEPGYLDFCRNIDEKRDVLELSIIAVALEEKIPVFGICRGLQILNVALKGSLFPDIPSEFPFAERHVGNNADSWHNVVMCRDSLLAEITGLISGQVNSSHHQCINRIAPCLKSVAISHDDIIEAVEGDKSLNHPFCLAVQWHPERMEFENPLSGTTGKAFINATEKYKALISGN